MSLDLTPDILLAARFLERSMNADGTASRGHFHLIKRKWSPPYPETTGYLIPTFLRLSKTDNQLLHFETLAREMAEWLLTLQMENGAFPAGYFREGRKQTPSIFNSAQIMLGLLAAFENFKEPRFETAILKCCDFLKNEQQNDGSWNRFGYGNNPFPSYYTRVGWPLILAGKTLGRPELIASGKRCLDHIATRSERAGEIKMAGFHLKDKAWLHTIAYTIRGFWEGHELLGEQRYADIVLELIEKLHQEHQATGKLSGMYNHQLKPLAAYRCLTGEAQLAIVVLKVFQKNRQEKWASFGEQLVRGLCKVQPRKDGLLLAGGIAGSAPIYGKYLPFKQLNWATKFFLDALLEYTVI